MHRATGSVDAVAILVIYLQVQCQNVIDICSRTILYLIGSLPHATIVQKVNVGFFYL